MLSPWIYLMMNGLFFTLRLSGGSGSFPRPLKAAEEREYLERAAQGDLADLITELTAQMHAAAEDLHFELAARLRDEIRDLKEELRAMRAAD